ncbi:MAG: class I SAM-dependent methyltransferase [Euryarchaeota archaeon]|jgi:trans-aconitate methyltransferase|nr:class I SAM-dependent methyltransferase [Euryarchaeota archaeon]
MRDATEVFSEWAGNGKDEGMERGHAASVEEMLNLAFSTNNLSQKQFSAIDIGCGNGWVVRKLQRMKNCQFAKGVDGAITMIEKAKEIDPEGNYSIAKLPQWKPKNPVDFIHSMEFLYYLQDPITMLKIIHDEWLTNGGVFVAGIDHYFENTDSLEWPTALDVHMTTLSQQQWREAMESAGFSDIVITKTGVKDGFIGTLTMLGVKQ